MASKKIALKSPSIASTYNEKDIKLWSISGWLEGFNVVGQPNSGTMVIPAGSFIQNGVVVVESSSQNLTISGTGTSSDPLILYAVANGPDELKSPTYAFVLKSSIPTNVAEIASNDGSNWSMLQGVSINEIINGIKNVISQHETPVTAGEAISKGNNIRISGGTSTGDSAGDTGKAFKATTDTIDHASVVGVALEGASSSEIFNILTQGVFSDSGLSLSQGKIHFLNTDSTFVSTQPASPSVTTVLGVALSSVDIVYIPEKSQATFTSFINNIENISNVGVKWSDTDKVKILNGSLVFNGRQYVLDVDPVKEIQLIDAGAAMDNGDSDSGHGNGALDTAGTGHQSQDTKKHSTWYYVYAKPNGTTFDPVFSTAPPNGLRRSARQLGKEDRTGVGAVAGFFVVTDANNVFKVKIDGDSQIYTLTINGAVGSPVHPAFSFTDSAIADLINNQSANDAGGTTRTSTWSPSKPNIRAFTIGNLASEFGVGLCAYGKFGLNSILDIQSAGNTMNSLLGFVATDGTNPYTGQDWKWLEISIRNDENSNIKDFTFHRESNLFLYRNVYNVGNESSPGFLVNVDPTGGGTVELDASDMIPVGSRRGILKFDSTEGIVHFREKDTGSFFETGWNGASGAGISPDFIISVSKLQRFFVKITGNDARFYVLGFFPKE